MIPQNILKNLVGIKNQPPQGSVTVTTLLTQPVVIAGYSFKLDEEWREACEMNLIPARPLRTTDYYTQNPIQTMNHNEMPMSGCGRLRNLRLCNCSITLHHRLYKLRNHDLLLE